MRVAEENGEQWCLSYALYMLSLTTWRRGDLETAWSLGLRGVRLRAPFLDSLGLAMGIDILGWVAAAGGKYEHAARLLGATGPIWESVGALEFGFGDQVASYHAALARCREQLGDARFEAAFNSGAKLDLREAVALVLSDQELPALRDEAAPAPAGRTSARAMEWRVNLPKRLLTR
ncbi:hypothetical protein ACFOSC_21380 [Streptantibioticus rubrisoli]|uniref:Uncharacterized protein n=1 Tax=Streptantibioticus rubrisoli TaxID=1387313 RepID=A0ABT1P850_9ACTN|nr:hypothetical protein [Streptantibioticus rubrisoli]MCQ4040515.1 hypothetical protein [Streptantibioticus rubrisoli]